MTKLELSKLIMDYGDFRVEANTLEELRNYETELVDRLYEAINYTRSCTELPSKEEMTFDEWLKFKKIEHTERGVYKWEGSFYNDTYIKKCYEIYRM